MNDPGDSTPSSTVSPAEPAPRKPSHPNGSASPSSSEAGDWSAFASLRGGRLHEAAAALARHPRCEAGARRGGVRRAGRRRAAAVAQPHYRGKDAPTNVLSFPFQPLPGGDGGGGRHHLGDVVLAAETVLSEAAEQGIAPVHHLQHLVVHGLLHLLGFDHDTDASADDMERLEAEILATLGIANPYALAEGGVTVA